MFDRKSTPIRSAHLCSALLIALGNHLVGLQSQKAHIDYMAAARRFYRNDIIEPVLLVMIAWQVVSGLAMVIRGWNARRGLVAWLQALSSLYLAFFLLNHLAAVVAGRTLLELDTDFRFAAAGFFGPPWQLFFAPYYFLAVCCLFLHIGCASYWQLRPRHPDLRNWVLSGFAVGGAVIALLLVLALAGVLYPVDIPEVYRATFAG